MKKYIFIFISLVLMTGCLNSQPTTPDTTIDTGTTIEEVATRSITINGRYNSR